MESPNKKTIEHLQEGKMNESIESLQAAIQILKEVADKFHSLKEDATTALLDPEDIGGYKEKLEERARLLINLPGSLAEVLEKVNPQIRQKILSYVETFAATAQERLNEGGEIGLATLLVDKGSKKGDKNDLEKLIEFLEGE